MNRGFGVTVSLYEFIKTGGVYKLILFLFRGM